ncbi:MAG: uroporphyrinogen decarboxylase family protein, partial [Deltaproteobacteria bacterium]|nr:uroporphyrinogen decarboxylase family protein [Deltaproteobacteria bacterium]
ASIDRFPCGPLAVHNTAGLAGVSIEDYTLKPDKLADCIVHYYEQFEPDAVWVSADTWVTAQGMGAEVDFIGDSQPMCGVGEPLVKSVSDIKRIRPVDTLVQGRFGLMCEALSQIKERLGQDVFVVGCFDQSPFSLACALMGMEALMVKAIDESDFVDALLERCVEYSVAYALSLAHAGADMLSTGDSVAGLVGRKMYCGMALGAEQKMFDDIRSQCDALLSLHICGDTSHILSDMSRAGCDVLEIDSNVDICDAMEKVGDEIALWGNIDPVGVLQRGTAADVEREALKLLEKVKACGRSRFVLSSGCTMAPDTPEKNIRALIETAKIFEL